MSKTNVGLIGTGISGSLSPVMHETEGVLHGLDYHYRCFDFNAMQLNINELGELLSDLETQQYRGVNITYPCKQLVKQYLDVLDGDAMAIGAVNTVLFKEGKRIGYNTDGIGFYQSLKQEINVKYIKHVVIF
ncbi:MAG: shikimate dehydrogenase, partial [Gammaproteobacteria bacterium]|nr:shikimate dehydrogenase [Gammaproteobacteria bacterium]